MNNYDFPLGADCTWAPWNEPIETRKAKEPECPKCGESEKLQDDSFGRNKGLYICLSCDNYFHYKED